MKKIPAAERLRAKQLSAAQAQGMPNAEAYRRLLEHYVSDVSSPPIGPEWDDPERCRALHANLASYLERTDQFEQFVALLQAEIPGEHGPRNAWYAARRRLGQDAGYIEDLQRALRMAQKRSRRSQQRGEPITMLGLEVRFVLMLASVNSIAENISAELVGSLIGYGVWTPDVSLAYLRRKSNTFRRANALIALVPHLAADQVAEVISLARAVRQRPFRAKTLCRIAAHLPPSEARARLVEEALAELPRCTAESDTCAAALSMIAPFLQSEQLQSALEIVWKLDYVSERKQALLPHLFAERFQQVLTKANTHQAPYDRARTLLVLAATCKDSDESLRILAQACSAAYEVEHRSSRVHLLVDIAPFLPDSAALLSITTEMLASLRKISEERMQADALVVCAPFLMAEQLQEALQIARDIQDSEDRAAALGGIAPCLPTSEARRQALQEALAAAREPDVSSAPYPCLHAYVHGGYSRRAALLQPIALTLAANGEIEDLPQRVWALEGLAAWAAPDGLQSLVEMAGEIPHAATREEAKHALLPHLQDTKRPQGFSRVEAMAYAFRRAHPSPAMRALRPFIDRLREAAPHRVHARRCACLKYLAAQPRPHLVQALPDLMPILQEQGGATTLTEVLYALRDVTRWW